MAIILGKFKLALSFHYMFNGVQIFNNYSNLFHIHQNPPIVDFVNLNVQLAQGEITT